jgi:hypothetical protein
MTAPCRSVLDEYGVQPGHGQWPQQITVALNICFSRDKLEGKQQ